MPQSAPLPGPPRARPELPLVAAMHNKPLRCTDRPNSANIPLKCALARIPEQCRGKGRRAKTCETPTGAQAPQTAPPQLAGLPGWVPACTSRRRGFQEKAMKQLHKCTRVGGCADPSQKPLQWVRPVSATSNRWEAACPSSPRQSCPCKCNRPQAPKSIVLPAFFSCC